MDSLFRLNHFLNTLVWGPAMLALLLGTGIFLSLRCGFPQLRHAGWIARHTLGSLLRRSERTSPKDISPFQAMTTALAGTAGTGNIAGVTGALFAGGPGAVFWMWVSALFGMCTKYAEIALAIRYRETGPDGAHYGGPMYYIEKGLGPSGRPLALLFSLFAGLAGFGIGNLAQSTEIASVLQNLGGVDRLSAGLCLAALTGFVLFGGIRRVGSVTSVLVPFMALFYLLAGLAVLLLRLPQVPSALALIVRSAFSPRAAGGGVLGYGILLAMRHGFARGVFSNEAGLGSAPMAHASAAVDEPCEQALWGVFEVFLDTIVLCTITALAVILSGVLDTPGGLRDYGSNSAAAAAAFNRILPGSLGGTVIQLGLLFFALSTIFSWGYYGSRCWAYLSGQRAWVQTLYKLCFALVCLPGALGSGTQLWEIADTLNGLMALPNLIALLLLSGTAARMTHVYFARGGGLDSRAPSR